MIEADILDRMNETTSLIAQRAYEIYESRGGGYGFDQDDWFRAEGELLPKFAIEYDVTDSAVRLTTQVPGFDAKDLEVEVGHRRAQGRKLVNVALGDVEDLRDFGHGEGCRSLVEKIP